MMLYLLFSFRCESCLMNRMCLRWVLSFGFDVNVCLRVNLG